MRFLPALLLLLSFEVRADVPTELYPPGRCQPQPVVSQESDGKVTAVSGLRCRRHNTDFELIELIIKSADPNKEIQVYDHNLFFEFERTVKVAWASRISRFQVVRGAGFTLGKGPTRNSERVVIALTSEGQTDRHRPVDVYVKAGNAQLRTLNVQIGY